jgi:hypothetical protein
MIRDGFDMSETVFQPPGWTIMCTPLQFVVYKGKLPTVQFLLEKGVNPNVRVEAINAYTPLILSINKGFHQISEKLIVSGCKYLQTGYNWQNSFILGSGHKKQEDNKSPVGSRC